MRYGMFREDVLQPDRNPAMTDVDNDTALNPLGAMQKSVKQGLGPDATPSQLQVIKQAFGNRVNWRKNVSVCEGIVTDFNQAVLQNQIACRETGVYLQERFSQEHGLDLFGRLVNRDRWPRKPQSLPCWF